MKRFKIGMIGCGVISKVYLGNIEKYFPKLQVIACADISAEKARQTAAEHGIEKACTVEELLLDENVDIVLNLTVPKAHYELNKRALMSGKNVYCEKPLALTYAEAGELTEIARRQGVMLGCAPDSFLGASLQTCRKLIDEGWIGRPVGATANMMSHGVETWHASPDFYYKQGGGPMMDMGPYYVTALVSLLGPVSEAGCFVTKGLEKRKIYSKPRRGEYIDVEVPTHYAGILKFENQVAANINMSFDAWLSNLPKLEIYGTEGTLIVPDPNQFGGKIQIVRCEELIDEVDGLDNEEATGKLSRPEMWEKYREVPSFYRQPAKNMRGIGLLDMAYALEYGRENRASAELAGHVTEVLEALQKDGGMTVIESRCQRPMPVPVGLDVGEMDGSQDA